MFKVQDAKFFIYFSYKFKKKKQTNLDIPSNVFYRLFSRHALF